MWWTSTQTSGTVDGPKRVYVEITFLEVLSVQKRTDSEAATITFTEII